MEVRKVVLAGKVGSSAALAKGGVSRRKAPVSSTTQYADGKTETVRGQWFAEALGQGGGRAGRRPQGP